MFHDPATLIDKLEQIREHFLSAINLQSQNLPHSATAEEILGTRKINNIILDLQETVTKQNRIATNRRNERNCKECCGHGFVEIQSGPYTRKCEACNGTGKSVNP